MMVFPFASAWAQKAGGILRITHRDSPASMSIHEEGTISVVLPMMGVFNNLVMFDQHKRQNSLDDIVPDLAEKWTWSEDGKKLTFALRSGVTWHDGKPFTAADVKCTMDLLAGTAPENFKVNFRKGWYANVESVTVNGEREATFNLKAPQPALLALLASGFTPDLSLPCPAGQDAPGADRHRAVQVRRVQVQPEHQARAQPELLEEGPALSRRHRIHDHHQPLDDAAGLRLGQVRRHLPLRDHRAAGGRRQEPDAERRSATSRR